jgi:hypothetical protein
MDGEVTKAWMPEGRATQERLPRMRREQAIESNAGAIAERQRARHVAPTIYNAIRKQGISTSYLIRKMFQPAPSYWHGCQYPVPWMVIERSHCALIQLRCSKFHVPVTGFRHPCQNDGALVAG